MWINGECKVLASSPPQTNTRLRPVFFAKQLELLKDGYWILWIVNLGIYYGQHFWSTFISSSHVLVQNGS